MKEGPPAWSPRRGVGERHGDRPDRTDRDYVHEFAGNAIQLDQTG